MQKEEYPLFSFSGSVTAYPDRYFIDGIHIQQAKLPQVSKEYAALLDHISSK